MDFRGWIQEHLEKGAGALHRFCNQDNKTPCALEEIHMAGGTLCNSEELMRERVSTWSKLWGTRDKAGCCEEVRRQQLKLLAACRIEPEESNEDVFPLAAVKACIRSAPPKAALGADQWRPHDWSRLPDEGIEELRDTLFEVERRMRWPAQALHNVAVFLGKPTTPPSERSITLTAGLYRLWCKLRRPAVQAWENVTAGFWDKAVAGSSALQAAIQRELQHEVANSMGVCTGGIYWDMAKFYDCLLYTSPSPRDS